jgi:hypothetical protein
MGLWFLLSEISIIFDMELKMSLLPLRTAR